MPIRIVDMLELVGALAVASLAATPGCDAIAELTGRAEPQPEQRAPDDEALEAKLEQYVLCINVTSASAARAHRYYTRWLTTPDAGPTGHEKPVDGTLKLVGVEDCEARIDEARDMDPDLEDLDGAATQYLEALKRLAPLNAEAYAYYDRGRHEQDDFARGKELHPALTSAFDRFVRADAKFREAYHAHGRNLDRRQLERHERSGRELAHSHLRFMMEARELARIARAPLERLDADAYERQLKETDEALDTLDDCASRHAEQRKELAGFDAFMKEARRLLEAGEALRSRKREGRAYTSAELRRLGSAFPEEVDGSPEQVIHRFNETVVAANQLR